MARLGAHEGAFRPEDQRLGTESIGRVSSSAQQLLRGRDQMIKQRLDQAAGALLRELCAKDSLGYCQTMSEIDDNRDEIIRLQA